MQPGRELDCLVYEKVMGGKFWVEEYKKTWNQKVPYKRFILEGCKRHEVHEYSTDLEAAWEVVEKFKEFKYKDYGSKGISVSYRPSDGKWVVGWPDCTDYSPCEGISYLLPHAICLAALEAVGWKP